MKLKNKVIVITGSSRGIGREIASACARQGAKVVICSRNPSDVKKVCDKFKMDGFDVSGTKADVSIASDIEKLYQFALKTYNHIDVWINNAGISGGFEALDEKSYEQILSTVNINLTATLNACKLIIPYFIKQGGGIIINLSGRGGEFKPAPFMTTYAATKAAVVSLTKSLAQENEKYPLSIHSVYPGMVVTDMHKDIKIGTKSSFSIKSLPYVLKAFGVPIKVVGQAFTDIAAQKPGRVTGKNYSLLKGFKMMRAICMITYFSITGKIKRE